MGLKVLWLSAAPMWRASGYGRQTNYTVKALQQLPEVERIAVACSGGFEWGTINFNGVDHISGFGVEKGSDALIAAHMRAMGFDVCISLMDVWPMPQVFASANGGGNFKWVPIVPIDGYPLSRQTQARLVNAHQIIAMSQFGKKTMEERLPQIPITYIPHCIDTSIYRPLGNKKQFKKMIGFPEECFLVGMVAANTQNSPVVRKGFPEAIKAFSEFVKIHPDARLYLHALPYVGPESADVFALCDMYGLDFAKYVIVLDPYMDRMGISDQQMAMAYNAMDVYFAPSAGEGFNVPLIEAQASGIPVVANAATAQTENVGVGWLVPPLASVAVPTNTQWYLANPLGSDSACESCGHVTHQPGLLDALCTAYDELHDEKKARRLSIDAVKFGTKFDVRAVITTYWRSFLQELAKGLGVEAAPVKLWQPGQGPEPTPIRRGRQQ